MTQEKEEELYDKIAELTYEFKDISAIALNVEDKEERKAYFKRRRQINEEILELQTVLGDKVV